jgi:hypothetical protein
MAKEMNFKDLQINMVANVMKIAKNGLDVKSNGQWNLQFALS